MHARFAGDSSKRKRRDDHLDEAEEEIFTDTVSDEALEAAAGPVRGSATPDPETDFYCSRCCKT